MLSNPRQATKETFVALPLNGHREVSCCREMPSKWRVYEPFAVIDFYFGMPRWCRARIARLVSRLVHGEAVDARLHGETIISYILRKFK